MLCEGIVFKTKSGKRFSFKFLSCEYGKNIVVNNFSVIVYLLFYKNYSIDIVMFVFL